MKPFNRQKYNFGNNHVFNIDFNWKETAIC